MRGREALRVSVQDGVPPLRGLGLLSVSPLFSSGPIPLLSSFLPGLSVSPFRPHSTFQGRLQDSGQRGDEVEGKERKVQSESKQPSESHNGEEGKEGPPLQFTIQTRRRRGRPGRGGEMRRGSSGGNGKMG